MPKEHSGRCGQESAEIYCCRYERGRLGISETAALEHRLGRGLLEMALRGSFGLALSAEELAAAVEVPPGGKPHLKGYPAVHFNISHCAGLVVCAVSDRRVGVDVERPEAFPEVLVRRVLAAEERQLLEKTRGEEERFRRLFYRFWTLKEAYVKRSGEGMDADVRGVVFRPDMERCEQMVRCSDPGVFCWQSVLPGGYILALCMDNGDVAARLQTQDGAKSNPAADARGSAAEAQLSGRHSVRLHFLSFIP